MIKTITVTIALLFGGFFLQEAHALKQCWTVGDLDNDGAINIIDMMFLANYLYSGGPAPERMQQADFDDNGSVNATDLILFSQYLYQGCYSCLGDLDTICEITFP